MEISVIMPAYNAARYLGRTLPPLMAMLHRGEVIEVLVVDDASTDTTASTAAGLGATVIDAKPNRGPAAARNLGARRARGEVLWFVDADVTVHGDAGQRVAAGLDDPAVSAIVGSYDDKPPAPNFLSRYKNLVHHYHHQRRRRVAAGFWAGCGAIKASVFAQIGGYDEARFCTASIEDIELGYRVCDAGGQITALPELKGTHLKTWRLRELLHTEVFERALPWSRLMLERGALVDELNVSLPERVRALLALALILTIAGLGAGLSPWWSLGCAALVLLANFHLMWLFTRTGGVGFALAALGFHQLYYLYSSAAFVWVWAGWIRSPVPRP